MSITYSTVEGDTFERVSRKVYGTELRASLLRQANPGVGEPLPVGIPLATPAAPVLGVAGQSGGVDEVSVTINGRRFRYWDSITLRFAIDSVDTVELTAPFEPNDLDFRDNFRPFTYPIITAQIGDDLEFTGTLTTVKPVTSASGRAVAAGAYSLPGVLQDCCAPSSVYTDGATLEFTGVDLRQISNTLLAPFGLNAVFQASPGPVFEQVSAKASEEVLPFLAKLAKQRGLVITSDAKGQVLFWVSDPGGNPVAKLVESLGPVFEIDADFRTDTYYSSITGLEPTSLGLDGGAHTERNERLPGVVRPFTFEATDAEGESLSLATKAKMGRMFGDAVTYTLAVHTWRDAYGRRWRPNTTIIVHAPGAMIYKPYEFLIREVELKRSGKAATATLTLVIPDAYRGKVPEHMPWDE